VYTALEVAVSFSCTSCTRATARRLQSLPPVLQWLLHKTVDIPDFSCHVLWINGKAFTKSGVNNPHNSHERALWNPHSIQCSSFQQRFNICILARIIGNYIPGPYMVENHLNGIKYTDFVERTLPLLVEDVPLDVHEGV
jgi:hypothetical protein